MRGTIMENCNIKIYVVCHKPSYIPENPYLYPIQVGVALEKSVLQICYMMMWEIIYLKRIKVIVN